MANWITRRAWPVLRSTWNGWWEDDGSLLSAATAYYAAFSLFPVCLVVIAIIGLLGPYSTFLQDQRSKLIEAAAQNVSPWLAGQLEDILTSVQSEATLGGPLGLLALILAAIGIFMQLESIVNRIWHTPGRVAGSWLGAIRDALWDRLLAFVILLAIGSMLIVVFLADIVLAGLRHFLVQLPVGQLAWQIVPPLATVVGNALLLTVIYKVLPRAPVRWREALGGGLLAAVLWTVGQHVLLYLVVGEKYSAYGVFGALIALMFWFYYASAAVFIGAEFVRALAQQPTPKRP